jgi:hypothetical protein
MGGGDYGAAGFPLCACCCIYFQAVLGYVSQPRGVAKTVTSNAPVTGEEYRDMGKHKSSRLEGVGG